MAFIAYGVYDIAANGYTHERGVALAADVAAAVIPGVTGAGMAVRAGNAAVDAARAGDAAVTAARAPTQCYNSFTGDTPVLTPEGHTPIAEIEEGDAVLAFNPQTRTTGVYTVTDVISHPSIAPGSSNIILALDGETLETTPEHKFFTVDRGWVEAEDLVIGDQIAQADGSPGAVVSIRAGPRTERMFNLTVNGAHTFFVGDQEWLVHNCGGFASGKPPHVAEVTVTRNGEEVYSGTFRSGNMTPEEAALGFPRSSLATHTENRAVRQVPLEAGDDMVIRGQYPPCPSCRGAMNRAARETGANITYTWEDRTWTAGGRGRR